MAAIPLEQIGCDMFPHVSPGVLVQRLYDADLKREISRVWPSLPQKTVDLLVTPHKCQQTQIHVVVCGHTIVISASIKLSNFGGIFQLVQLAVFVASLLPSTVHLWELHLPLPNRQRADGGKSLCGFHDF